jgi:hypothetical protein
MKTISLWQPWAIWIPSGLKKIETRMHGQFAPLVGERIAIHATAKPSGPKLRERMEFAREAAGEYLKQIVPGATDDEPWWDTDFLTFGAVLGAVDVVDHRKLTAEDSLDALIDCSDDDRYGLIFENPTMFEEPVPAKGALYAWEWAPPKGLDVNG